MNTGSNGSISRNKKYAHRQGHRHQTRNARIWHHSSKHFIMGEWIMGTHNQSTKNAQGCTSPFSKKNSKDNHYDVKDQKIKNSKIRKTLGSYTLHQSMELRRFRWLEKLAKMGKKRLPKNYFMLRYHKQDQHTDHNKQRKWV